RRSDGFHSLLSWFATVGLFDNLVLEQHSPAAGSPPGGMGAGRGAIPPGGVPRDDSAASVQLECDMPGLPCDERNLVVKIALAFARDTKAAGAPRINDGKSGEG